jgi:hypothetical protein
MRSGRYLNSVREALPEAARSNLDLALAGDALAARRLMIVAPRRLRGHIASLAYQLKTRNPAYRELIKAVWAQDTRHLLTAHWSSQMVRRMLVRAEIPVPELNGPVTIYRPVGDLPLKKAKAGLCWTLSRDVALSEAALADGGEPRILQATLDPGEIIYWGNGRGEQEIVSRRPVHAVIVEPASLPRRTRRTLGSHRR